MKAFAVVWPGWDKFVTNAHHNRTNAMAIFASRVMAKEFAAAYTKKSVMKVVPIEIIYILPSKKSKSV